MRVLVTGGCGLIGFHTAKHYRELGYEVDVMDNLERSDLLGHEVSDERKNFNKNLLQDLGVHVYQYDVSKEESWGIFSGHDVIVHLAAQCGVPTSIANPRRDYEVNLFGTFNALEYARRHDSKFVFASTNKVYPIHDMFVHKEKRWHFTNPSWAVHGFPVNNDLTGSRTPYGWSKYSADLLCQEYYHTYGIRTGVFRMSCIYGPNQFGFEEQGWATWLVIATEKGLPITIYGDGDQVRDMLYVEDVVRAYDSFVQSDVEHGVYNLGGGVENTLSLNECIYLLEKLTGKKSSISYEGWRPSDQKSYVSNISDAVMDLGWYPRVNPLDGLKKVHEWVRENVGVF